jgi:molybdopterin molybdotransferase
VRLKGFQKLTSTDEALRTWLNILQIKRGREVLVPLNDALNRVLAINVTAKEDLPRFDKSAVDGYALKAEDTMGASQFKPVVFQSNLNRQNRFGLEIQFRKARMR